MHEQFIELCRQNKLDDAKQLYNLDIITNVNISSNVLVVAFIQSCSCNHLSTAKWLYSLITHINMRNPNKKDIFRSCCLNNCLDVAKWLYSLDRINIHTNNDEIFRWSCLYNCQSIVQWLLSIDKFDNKLVDKYLPDNLYEYAFQLGYIGYDNMKSAYEQYKFKIREQIKEKNTEGVINLFEMTDLVNIITEYV